MKFEFYGEEYELKFVKNNYTADNSIYIGAMCIDKEHYGEPFGNVTVCIPMTPLKENEIILDTNNSGELIKEMIKDKYIKLTDRSTSSGYCVYPIGVITDKLLKELDAKEMEV